ncbi:MAG: flavodoxin family protein [Candidatus Thorarchaeota archaeon]
MQVLVFNGSPRGERGATAGVLKLFIEGIESAGANVELVYVNKLNISPCRGCFNCWTKTPGKCIQSDDMEGILDKLASADIIVFGTPLYVDGMTGPMKVLLDRSIPLMQGKFELRDDHCRHPLREHVKSGKVVLVSVSGFTELDNFDPLIAHIKAICKNMDREYVGAIIRPIAHMIPYLEEHKIPVEDVIASIRAAGVELIENGVFSKETLKTIERELIDREMYIKGASASFS